VRSQPDISSEIATVDEVRNVLRARQPRAALVALDRYDARFGRVGSLREEAAALRIEALLQSGKRERATTLARAFLAQHAQSPYAARVRALVAEPAH
jgi:pheromone shutdown protein TraB